MIKKRETFGPADLAKQNVATSNLIAGGASAEYDTLKEIEDKIKGIKTNGVAKINDINVVGELDSVDDLKIAGKVTNNYGEIFNHYISNKASGDYSHAEGHSTIAEGQASHAEGEITKALGYNSHAEGYHTQAKGSCSHAEGYNTSALGGNSHAEGDYATASGPRSHAEGRYTIAASDCQHVQGKYNVRDSEGKYAFIIGNGASTANRSNAFAIDWDGNIYINNSENGVDLLDIVTRLVALEEKVTGLIS